MTNAFPSNLNIINLEFWLNFVSWSVWRGHMNSLGERFVLGIDKFEKIYLTMMLILLLYTIKCCSSRCNWFCFVFPTLFTNYFIRFVKDVNVLIKSVELTKRRVNLHTTYWKWLAARIMLHFYVFGINLFICAILGTLKFLQKNSKIALEMILIRLLKTDLINNLQNLKPAYPHL